MLKQEVIRAPSHAGSWYSSSKSQLNSQLQGWLDDVKTPIECIGPKSQGETVSQVPAQSARIIIAPHAGYSYSGPAAAWAYKSWDASRAKRVFVLGPSHHFYLSKAALTRCTNYATPLGNLTIDRETTAELHKTGQFEWMSQSVDEDEHSLEMHLPYIYKTLANTFGDDPSKFPMLVPIMVGNTSRSVEQALGRILAPYLTDLSTAFVISSDFAHWGQRFRYTYYRPSLEPEQAMNLSASEKAPKDPPIHDSIKAVDFECMAACESGSHDAWLSCLEENGNTVCGRHPIGVIMAAMEEVRKAEDAAAGATEGNRSDGPLGGFRFVRYDRSSEVKRVSESSVSYASAFAIL